MGCATVRTVAVLLSALSPAVVGGSDATARAAAGGGGAATPRRELSGGGVPCFVAGQGGLKYWERCEEGPLAGGAGEGVHVPIDGKVTWACPVPGYGVALCDESRSLLRLWRRGGGTGNFTDVGLGPLKSPVGAVYLDGKVYVACFGTWRTPRGDSGLAVVDVESGRLEAYHVYHGPSHVHNVYAFRWDGGTEIFVVSMGNPWISPPMAGDGIVRFDRATGSFLKRTTKEPVSARSAVQASEGVFYVLTQEERSRPTRLVRLELRGGSLSVAAETSLPARSGGDGGADVLLGDTPDSVICTDREQGGGKIYHYTCRGGSFQAQEVRSTGANPRYATVLRGSGDIVVCNQDDATVQLFPGLAKDPASRADAVRTSTLPVTQASFFMMSALIPAASPEASSPGAVYP